MANITSIKLRNDETVHPIALPFAICDAAATTSLKTLTFSGGDTPTELVNGQQIMVQFTNGSNVAAPSINVGTFTIPLVINNSDSSVAPYIGEGAVVCLTYNNPNNNPNFYISNAAALTGFKVPTNVTLATITNEGTITNINNNGIITTLDSSNTITNLINAGAITSITSSGTILGLINAQNGVMGISGDTTTQNAIINRGIITRIKNDSGSDGNGGIQVLYNDSSALVDYVENHGKIKEIQNPGTIGNEGLPTLSGGLTNKGHLYKVYNNELGTIYTIDNGGLVSKVSNSGTITELKNSWYSVTDFGTIEQFINEADIKTLTIGTSGDWRSPGKVETLYNHAGSFTYTSPTFTLISGINYFENKGRIVTEENTGDIGFAGTVPAVPEGYTPTGNNYDPDTGIQNTTGVIHNIQNDYKGLHSHNAVIRHIANYGGNGTGGISLFDNGGDLSYLVNLNNATGAVSALPGGNIGEIINYYKINKISNINNNNEDADKQTLITTIDSTGVISNINNYGTITFITNNSSGTIDGINNNGTINGCINYGDIVAENRHRLMLTNHRESGSYNEGEITITNEGPTARKVSGSVNILNKGGEVHLTNAINPEGDYYSTVEITNAGGDIATITNQNDSTNTRDARISTIINRPSVYDGSAIINEIKNQTSGGIGLAEIVTITNYNYGHISYINNSSNSQIGNINNDSQSDIDSIDNSGRIDIFANSGTINASTNSGTITTFTNRNNGTISTMNNNGNISTLTNKGIISTLTNNGNGRINNLSNLTAKIGLDLPLGAIKECTVGTVIEGGIWKIDPGFSLVHYGDVQVDNSDLGMRGYNCHYIAQSGTDSSSLLYKAAGTTFYPIGASGDPYYVSPQGTAGNNCLLIIWEGVSIGHEDGDSTSVALAPGIYRIYYTGTVNKVYHYQIYKLNFGRL